MKVQTRVVVALIWPVLLALFLCTSDLQPSVLAQAHSASTQTPGGPPRDQDEGFTVTSIPIVGPLQQAVTQEGTGLALAERYHLGSGNKNSSSSSTAIGGFVTTNQSWGVGIGQRLYLRDDRWRVRLIGSYGDVRYNYYGIGTESGDRKESVLLEQRGWGALGEIMYRFTGLWYAGAQYRFLTQRSSFRPNPIFDPKIPPDQLDQSVASLGPRVMRDSRDDIDYPREGSLFDLRLGFNGEAVGSAAHFQTYDLSYNKYISFGPRQVLAVRGASCFTGDNVPFYNLCLLTTAENLRGYRASQYRDRTMLATQAEYRLEAFKRVGFVGFMGAGEIGPRLGAFNWGDVLPGGGLGVRYRITKERHVNVRFDYAWGKNSHEAYFYIGEAF